MCHCGKSPLYEFMVLRTTVVGSKTLVFGNWLFHWLLACSSGQIVNVGFLANNSAFGQIPKDSKSRLFICLGFSIY